MYTGTVGCHPELCRKTQGSYPTHPPEGVFLAVPPDYRSFGKLRTGAGALPPSTGSGQALWKPSQLAPIFMAMTDMCAPRTSEVGR